MNSPACKSGRPQVGHRFRRQHLILMSWGHKNIFGVFLLCAKNKQLYNICVQKTNSFTTFVCKQLYNFCVQKTNTFTNFVCKNKQLYKFCVQIALQLLCAKTNSFTTFVCKQLCNICVQKQIALQHLCAKNKQFYTFCVQKQIALQLLCAKNKQLYNICVQKKTNSFATFVCKQICNICARETNSFAAFACKKQIALQLGSGKGLKAGRKGQLAGSPPK